MNRPKVLDLFCGQGGAGTGYQRAGFLVTGVDNNPGHLERYPFDSIEADAIEFLLKFGHMFDIIHASPVCTGYSRGTIAMPGRLDRYDRLIATVRAILQDVGRPYVIENVEGAKSEMHNPIMLCGRQFGLEAIDDDGTRLILDRHRLFESDVPLLAPWHDVHDSRLQVAGVYGGARRDKREAREDRGGGYVPPSLEVLRTLIGAPWMTEEGCFLSIPPAYTEFVGEQLLDHLARVAA